MLNKVREKIKAHYVEMDASIKLVDIEEWFDLVFSRPLGLLFAKLGYKWNMHPNQVSVASLIVGVIGGALLYYQNDVVMTVTGSLLVTFAGVLDSADGQLARISKQSSEFGRIVDGLIDNFVFISCYIFATIYFANVYGSWVWIFSVFAGLAQSTKSGIYEFYKSEYLFFAGGEKSSKILYPEDIDPESWNKTLLGKVLYFANISYTKRQFGLTTRSISLRDQYETYAFSPETQDRFQQLYKKQFKSIMTWWALFCGSNFHRTLIMLFSIMGRFDIYIGINIVTYVPMYIINYVQKRKDDAFLKILDSEFKSA